MDKTIILKSTPQGLVVDTVVSSVDSLHLKAEYHATVSIPDNTVKVIFPEKSHLDVFSTWAIIVGGLAGLAGAIVAFWQLFKKDKLKEKQISELILQTKEIQKQTEISEKRLRMIVKPRIWCSTYSLQDDRIVVELRNRGEVCYVDTWELILEDSTKIIGGQSGDTEIIGGVGCDISIPVEHPNLGELNATLKLRYHDMERFKYVTTFQLMHGTVTFLDIEELQ
ncbi:hypothetical protein [Mangrovibacterium marinum]|uniref:hypothetical protein n=1 Tax=Mangrovibacterium marinum TaxID=1639118 RepID=UPI002A18777A|nr:hypothetical protein [Mangrovibacterium marinum]